MNKFVPVAASLLIATALSACAPGINTPGQRITFDSNGMVIHARGEPNAHVTPAGDLRIGDKPIAVTAAQRELLQRYYQQANSAMTSGYAMGKQGVAMAESGLNDAVASIFHHGDDAAEKKMDAQSQKIEASADALCQQIKAVGDTQVAIAAGIPAFKPYATTGDRMQCGVSHTTVVRHADGSTTTTSSLMVPDGNDANIATTKPATPAGHPGSTSASTSSEP